jgi:hypothetical protein
MWVGLGVDRGDGVERIGEPVEARGAGHELGDPERAGGAARERVEAGLGVELGGQHAHRHVPAQRRTGDRVVEARRDEARQVMVDARVVTARWLP